MDLSKFIRNIDDWPKKGVIYKDITPLLMNPEAFQASVDYFYNRYKNTNIDKIVAIESRGFIWGATLAYKLSLPLVIARKEGKLPCKTVKESFSLEYGHSTLEIHEDAIQENDNILLFDDILATGGTASAVGCLIESLRANVLECSFLLELTTLKKIDSLKNYKTFSLLNS